MHTSSNKAALYLKFNGGGGLYNMHVKSNTFILYTTVTDYCIPVYSGPDFKSS